MNLVKRIYCRTFQSILKLALPFLPYRQPNILKAENEVLRVLQKENITSVLVVTDQGIKKLNLLASLVSKIENNNIKIFLYDKVVPNPTSQNVEEALAVFKNNACQAIIAFGGGSVMDCAKATGARFSCPKKSLAKMKGVMKVRKKLPLLIAVPTTAGTGSETTLAAVITDSQTRHKYAINDFPLIPDYALLDAKLTIGLPKHITATTGMDALTHAIEAYIGKSTTKQTRKCALLAIKLIFENILIAYNDGQNLKARESMLIASYNAGLAFTKSYVGYVHAIAHSLGGKYNIAHGLANAIILPYVLKKYGKKIYNKLWKIGIYTKLFDKTMQKKNGAKLVIEKLETLNKEMGIENSIPQIEKLDIPELAKTAEREANPLYPVPVLYNAKELEEIYFIIKGENS